MSKIIIAGSRNFGDRNFIFSKLDSLFLNKEIEEVVCGEAKGPDVIGKEWAIANNIPVRSFFPNWSELGKVAGIVRNAEMGKYADILVAFWDYKSPGTRNMIGFMKKQKKKTIVIDTRDGSTEVFEK